MADTTSDSGEKTPVHAKLDNDVLKKIDAIAKERDRSRSQVINRACAEYVAKRKPTPNGRSA